MDLRYSYDELIFRDELRDWLAGAVPAAGAPPAEDDWRAKRDYDTGWQRSLFDAGYAGINWPAEFGGRGASPQEHLIFLEESERAGAPYVGVNFIGLLHAGPTIMVEGSDEQRAHHLPAILKGEHVWCQGFSEPEAGSDLASLRTRAVRDGHGYILNGQKIWTSHAQVADYCEMLVRTDPDAPKHAGISYLLIPMDQPGIEVSPLKQMTGGADFNQVFLTDAKTPKNMIVGKRGEGWAV